MLSEILRLIIPTTLNVYILRFVVLLGAVDTGKLYYGNLECMKQFCRSAELVKPVDTIFKKQKRVNVVDVVDGMRFIYRPT